MPKLSGVFEELQGLGKLVPQDILKKVEDKSEASSLENFIGNRLLYPQTVSVSVQDQKTDFAILKAYILKNPNFFYPSGGKVTISKEFFERFPPPVKLVTLIVRSINFSEQALLVRKEESGEDIIGTFVPWPTQEKDPQVFLDGQKIQLKKNSLSKINTDPKQYELKIGENFIKSVWGGEIGIIISKKN